MNVNRRRRAALSFAASTALMVGGITLGLASPASAAGGCSISVPSEVRVDAPYERIVGRLQNNCAASDTEYATWDVYHPRTGFTSIFIFDGNTQDRWDFYSFDDVGTYQIEPGGAWDYNYDDIAQNTRTVTVRFQSKLGLSASRSGKTVTLKAVAKRYSTSDKYVSWKSKPVGFYTKSCSSCSWKKVKSRSTNSKGVATLKVTKSAKRYYQVRTSNASTTWGRTSSVVRK